MKILLDAQREIYLEVFDKNFVLRKYSDVTGEGKQKSRVLGYYGTIEAALNGALHHRLLDSEATTLMELKEEIASFRTMVSLLLHTTR